jgi:hypothetical protein
MSPNDGGVINATGDLFATIPGVPSDRGVAMNPPPAAILGDVTQMVSSALSQMEPSEHARLVGIATKDLKTGQTNVNLAFAVKTGKHVEVVSWLGKSWGTPVAAAVVGGAGVFKW